jgi:glutamate synthase (NADPH/NADH) small chain
MKMRMIWEVIRNLFRRPITVRFPKEELDISNGYRGEHGFDIDKCEGCGLCARVCPNNAIEMVEVKHRGETKKCPQIDMSKCCYCGLCQDICPSGAIELTRNLPVSTPDPSSLIKRPDNMKRET